MLLLGSVNDYVSLSYFGVHSLSKHAFILCNLFLSSQFFPLKVEWNFHEIKFHLVGFDTGSVIFFSTFMTILFRHRDQRKWFWKHRPAFDVWVWPDELPRHAVPLPTDHRQPLNDAEHDERTLHSGKDTSLHFVHYTHYNTRNSVYKVFFQNIQYSEPLFFFTKIQYS